jgi:hypothetical protein
VPDNGRRRRFFLNRKQSFAVAVGERRIAPKFVARRFLPGSDRRRSVRRYIKQIDLSINNQ